MFNELVHRIDTLLKAKQPVLVAISGFGGSGKTRLAETIKAHFQNSDWIQLDNFLINHGEGEGWAGGYEWDRFESVLADARHGKPLRYQWYDWNTDTYGDWLVEVDPLTPLIIVEGVRLLQPRLMQYFDLTVWIDCSIEEATERGKARDRATGCDDEHLRRWDEIWVPKDLEYNQRFTPRQLATFIYPCGSDSET